MQARIDKDKLLNLLLPSQSLVEKRNLIPILSKALLKVEGKHLKIFVTDQENSLQGQVEVTGKPGEACVDSRTFFEIIKELPEGEISLEKVEKKEGLRIKTPSSVFNMVGVSPSDFPVFPEMKNPSFFSLEASSLASAIDQTLYCVSTDETRYHLNGVFFEKKGKYIRFVATDGHRLSYSEIDGSEKLELSEGIIVPRKGLHEIQRLISTEEDSTVSIALSPPRVLVRYSSFLLSIRLIEGQYPNYQRLLPKSSKVQIEINREALIQALKRVSILSSLQSKNVKFQWEKEKLILTASHPDFGDAKEEIPLVQGSSSLSIRFNAKYVLDCLLHTSGENVIWEMTDPSSPGVVRAKKTRGASIIMPMKL
ncbi:MAG: DNA polymerase III subunit beta [Bdellovibrionales bacterium]|nr:DNA polymerase III subunit beta [Bdellovibrionales bacterium]